MWAGFIIDRVGSRVAKRKAEGTVHTKHQLHLNPNPEGTQNPLDARRYDGREEQRIPRVGGSAGARCALRPAFYLPDAKGGEAVHVRGKAMWTLAVVKGKRVSVIVRCATQHVA